MLRRLRVRRAKRKYGEKLLRLMEERPPKPPEPTEFPGRQAPIPGRPQGA